MRVAARRGSIGLVVGAVALTASMAATPSGAASGEVTVHKSWSRTTVGSGAVVTATIAVTNRGSADTVVDLVDTFAAGLTVSGAPRTADGAPVDCDVSAGVTSVVSCPGFALAAGATRELLVDFRALYLGPEVVTGVRSTEQQLDVQKHEQYVSVPAGQERRTEVACPQGYEVVGRSVQRLAVDQGHGDLDDVTVAASELLGDGSWAVTLRNATTGQAQAKTHLTCVRRTTSRGRVLDLGAVRTAAVDLPGVGVDVPAHAVCDPHQVPAAVGFAGDGSVVVTGTSLTAGRHATVHLRSDSAGSGLLSWRCLGTTSGRKRWDLAVEERTVRLAPQEARVEVVDCGRRERALAAGWTGNASDGTESRGREQVHFLRNPGAEPLDVTIQALCVSTRLVTGGTTEADPHEQQCNTVVALPAAVASQACLSVGAQGEPDVPLLSGAKATGVDQQGSVDVAVRETRGPDSYLELEAGGARIRRDVTPGQSIPGLLFVAGPNGAPATARARVCNGLVVCSPWVTSTPITPYGPIGLLQVVDAETQLGPDVAYRVRVEPNGRALSVSVLGHSFVTSATGVWTSPRVTSRFGYATTQAVVVTASDATRTKTASRSLSTEPAPALTVAKGGRGNTSYCTTDRCHEIVVWGAHLLPHSWYQLWYNTDCAGQYYSLCVAGTNPGTTHYASVWVQTNGDGDFAKGDRYFGYPGARVWVDLDAFGGRWESNRVQW